MSRLKEWTRLLAAVALAVACAWIAVAPAAAHGSGAGVIDLELGGREDPLGVDDTAPTLSWRVEDARDGWAQTAYQIRAAPTERDLDRGRYLWDSGRCGPATRTTSGTEGLRSSRATPSSGRSGSGARAGT